MFSQKKIIYLVITFGVLGLGLTALAASNISAGALEHWAWNDVIGWIDFKAAPDNVNVFNNRLEGYAGTGVGSIALNCKTTPNGDICGISDFKVVNNGTGDLSGFAWNENIGWISFWCGDDFDLVAPGTQDTCTPANYRVSIDANGDFSGYAWNEVVGWISFNCTNDFDPVAPGVQSKCAADPGGFDYKINTSWRTGPFTTGDLTSSVFDTGVTEGAALQSLLWQGVKPAGAKVKFQIASSNCSNGTTNAPTCTTGSWTYVGPGNSTTAYYAPAGPDVSIALDRADHNNKRYFRYKVFLESNAFGDAAPTVDDIIINWSN